MDIDAIVYGPSHRIVKVTTNVFKEKAQERKMGDDSSVVESFPIKFKALSLVPEQNPDPSKEKVRW